jgi:hypothetical protein
MKAGGRAGDVMANEPGPPTGTVLARYRSNRMETGARSFPVRLAQNRALSAGMSRVGP